MIPALQVGVVIGPPGGSHRTPETRLPTNVSPLHVHRLMFKIRSVNDHAVHVLFVMGWARSRGGTALAV